MGKSHISLPSFIGNQSWIIVEVVKTDILFKPYYNGEKNIYVSQNVTRKSFKVHQEKVGI